MANAQSYAAQLGISASGPVSDRFEVVSASLQKTSQLVQSEGARGSRSRYKFRVRKQLERCSGNLVMEPSVTEIDKILPWFTGGTTTLGVTDVGNTLATRVVSIDRVTKVSTYAGCVVSRCTIEGNRGAAVRWTLDVEGTTETEGAAGSFPSLSLDTDNFFVFSDCSFSLGGTTRKPESFRLVVDNVLDTERFLNSLTREEIPSKDRRVTLEATFPYNSDHSDLYDVAIAGIAGSLVITDGSTTYTIAMANIKTGAQPREIPVRDEIKLVCNFQAFADASASEFKVTKS